MANHLKKIQPFLDKLRTKKVLVIGDAIIDLYVLVEPKGRAIKDPIMSTEYQSHEMYAGGVMAVANHVSSFVNSVTMVTLVGDRRTKKEFIEESLSDNVSVRFFEKEDAPTTVKKRFIDGYRNNKLFKVEYINDEPISPQLSDEIVAYLSKHVDNFDMVLVADFGHGFINDNIRRVLEEKAKALYINVQSNSANMGYNYACHYKKCDFITLNESEVRLPVMDRFNPIEDVMHTFSKQLGFECFMVTQGKSGTLFFDNGKVHAAPVLTNQVVDTVGSGDALFAISSLFIHVGAEEDTISFVANCAGGIKAKYMGNKEFINKENFIKFIKEIE